MRIVCLLAMTIFYCRADESVCSMEILISDYVQALNEENASLAKSSFASVDIASQFFSWKTKYDKNSYQNCVSHFVDDVFKNVNPRSKGFERHITFWAPIIRVNGVLRVCSKNEAKKLNYIESFGIAYHWRSKNGQVIQSVLYTGSAVKSEKGWKFLTRSYLPPTTSSGHLIRLSYEARQRQKRKMQDATRKEAKEKIVK